MSNDKPLIEARCETTVSLHIRSTRDAKEAIPYLLMGVKDPAERARFVGSVLNAVVMKRSTFDPALEVVLPRDRLNAVSAHLGDAEKSIKGPVGEFFGALRQGIDTFQAEPATKPEKS